MKIFLFANAIFVCLFIAFAILKIPIWGWVVFTIIWTLADLALVRLTGIHLNGWQWAGLLAGLSVIDIIVLVLT